MHIQTVDQLKAIKTVKGKLTDIGKMKVEEQREAVRAGSDTDILPPDLITFSKDAAELLAPAPYDGLYRHYVEAQLHYANGELERFNYARALWNYGLMTLRDYWCREHLPRRQVQALRLC